MSQSQHLGKAHYLFCAVPVTSKCDLSEKLTILPKEGEKRERKNVFLSDSISFKFHNGESMCRVINTGNIGKMGRADI